MKLWVKQTGLILGLALFIFACEEPGEINLGLNPEQENFVISSVEIPVGVAVADRGLRALARGAETQRRDRLADVRRRLYLEPREASPFDDSGALRKLPPLPTPDESGIEAYLSRYVDFFGGHALSGIRVGVYQHSAVGRDFLTRLLTSLGAEVYPFGRSETFVPVDTEAIDEAMLQRLSVEVKRLMAEVGPLAAVVSSNRSCRRSL